MKGYVFDSETGMLTCFASRDEALQGRDDEALRRQRWLFFAEDGSPLRVDFLADGSSQMRPWASCSSCTLIQLMPFVLGTGPGLDAAGELESLRKRLTL